ncbi:MAG: energy transducer TonB [Bacteroidaceae bacterium]|nr:energy transducer TonB [Bacteroidaceae bacterium]
MEIKKSASADLERGKSTALLMGFVFAFSVMFIALEWTQRDKEEEGEIYGAVREVTLDDELIPITLPEKKVVPPPPASVSKADIIDIVENDAEIEETVIASLEDQTEFIDISELEEIAVEPEPEVDDTPFMIVEDMPEFPGGQEALLKYLSSHIKYPSTCRENNIQGRVVLQFIVNKDGSIVDVEVIKAVNPLMDKEAVRVVQGMPKWKAGSQRGKPVRVKYTLPVNFRLN